MYPKRLSSFRIHVVYQFLMTGACWASETSEFYVLTSLNVQIVVVVVAIIGGGSSNSSSLFKDAFQKLKAFQLRIKG
jgi:uncharacterized membrane protein